jgi:hypothetical protein
MIKARHTYLATLLIMAFTTLFTVECRAAVLEQAAGYDVTHHATAAKDYNRLEAIETSNISTLIVAECRSKDGSIVALALYEYAIFEHIMVDRVTIIQP